jgi:D-inositol-3-phosphate glycosyltransferase
MRIVIVGTAYPLRGGIAHYVALLAETLRKRGHEVDVLTFSRQYPKLLFPGKSQEEAGAAEGAEINTQRAEQVIDSINPITWMKAGWIAAKKKPDMIIFKFWLPFFAPAYGVIARIAKRRAKKEGRDCRIVFIADNVIPHEKRPGDIALTRYAFRSVDCFVVQSDSVQRDLMKLVPSANFVKLAHPVYENFGKRIEQGDAKKLLGIPEDAPVILFFGYIRKYKGLDILLRAMPMLLKAMPELRLVVAGEYYGNESEHQAIVRDLKIPAKNLVLATDYIPNSEVAKYFSAANVVVLPYRSATQSGIVQIAYNFDLPVIATSVGGLSEVIIDGRSGLIAKNATPEAIAERVIHYFRFGLESKLRDGVMQEKKKYSWDTFAEGIERIAS